MLEEVGAPSFTPASLFDGLVLPHVAAHRMISHLQKECGHPFREPLHFIVIAVMSVISGTFPDTYRGFLHDGELPVYLGAVTSSSRLPSPKKRFT